MRGDGRRGARPGHGPGRGRDRRLPSRGQRLRYERGRMEPGGCVLQPRHRPLHAGGRLRLECRQSAGLDLGSDHRHRQPARPVQRDGDLGLAPVHGSGRRRDRCHASPRPGFRSRRAGQRGAESHLHGDSARPHRRHLLGAAERGSRQSGLDFRHPRRLGERGRRPHLPAVDRGDDGADQRRGVAGERHHEPALRQRRAAGRDLRRRRRRQRCRRRQGRRRPLQQPASLADAVELRSARRC